MIALIVSGALSIAIELSLPVPTFARRLTSCNVLSPSAHHQKVQKTKVLASGTNTNAPLHFRPLVRLIRTADRRHRANRPRHSSTEIRMHWEPDHFDFPQNSCAHVDLAIPTRYSVRDMSYQDTL